MLLFYITYISYLAGANIYYLLKIIISPIIYFFLLSKGVLLHFFEVLNFLY